MTRALLFSTRRGVIERDATMFAENKRNRVKRICFRVTTAPFREPRSLGSRVESRKINLSRRKTQSSTKSRRAPTRAPPIILIGGTPVTSRRTRRELPVTLPPPPPPPPPLLLLCARFERARALKIKTAPAVVRDDGDETNPVVFHFFFHAASTCASWSVGRYSRRTPLRLGWRSLRSALASIWRMRSRVTLNTLPISSSVFTRPSSKP